MTIQEAAAARAVGARDVTARPSQRRHADDADGTSAPRIARGFEVRADGATSPTVAGIASVTDTPYEMYDAFGPYTEIVRGTAFDLTLAASPLVEFTRNHGAGGGIPMAHTRNGTLTLSVVKEGDETGLRYEASVDPTRTDVADMLKAMQRGDLAEASFKFRITRGQWSPDWTEYHIEEVDLDRGDVSAVNFGANPYASSGVRQSPTTSPTAAPVAIDDADTARRVLISDADTRRRFV
jgi:HK97 family phage prohead protease